MGHSDYGGALGPIMRIWRTSKGQNVLFLEVFYPNLEAKSWPGAFEYTYRQTTEQFYAKFDEFLNLPLQEQLAIFP